jgi:hypothetical protein
LFEVTEALLCTDGPVKTLVGLSLAPQHRRGHGALYDRDLLIALDVGYATPRKGTKPPHGARLPCADASAWLVPDAATTSTAG